MKLGEKHHKNGLLLKGGNTEYESEKKLSTKKQKIGDGFVEMFTGFWVVVSNIFYVHPGS